MTDDRNLADVYIEYMEKREKGEAEGETWADFFDYAEVPKENRFDFAVGAILNELQKRGYFGGPAGDSIIETEAAKRRIPKI